MSKTKLIQRNHSGKLRPHEHTSYISLGIVLLFVGISLTAYTTYATSPPPQAESISLTGTMPGKAPTVAATITSLSEQQRSSSSPISIQGTCPANTLIEIFKNDIFAGSTVCGEDGKYSLDVDLLVGNNILIARVYDALNQAGPDSKSVTVYYDALPAQAGAITALDFGGAQLLLNTDAVYRGVFPNQALNMPIDIMGGTLPYAINIQWGDSSNKVIPRNDNVSFIASHTYTKAGNYQISLQASDAAGNIAFMTVAAIVNGQSGVAGAATAASTAATNKLLLLWPLYVSSAAVVISFYLGERREKRVLKVQSQFVVAR